MHVATTVRTTQSAEFRAVLRNRDFLLLWLGQLVSGLGDAVAAIAIMFYVTSQDASAGAFSTLALVEALPLVVVGPFIGVLVDRWDRKTILIAADLARGCLFLGLLLWPNSDGAYLVALLATIASLFFAPARSAILPELVSAENLTAAISLNQSTAQAVALTGPYLGGMLSGFWGTNAAFVFNAATFFFSALMALLVVVPPAARRATRPTGAEQAGSASPLQSFLSELGTGLTFLRKQAVLWFIIMTLTLVGAVGRFAYIGSFSYARSVLQLTPGQLGLWMTGSGIGAAVGALVAGLIGARLPRGRLFYLGFAGSFVALIPYLFKPSFPALLALGLVGAVAQSLFQVPLTAIFYSRTPTAMRGKVFSAANSLMNGVALVVLPLAAIVVGRVGAAATVGLTGAIGAVYAGATLLLPGARAVLHDGEPTPSEVEAAMAVGPTS